MKPQRHLSSIMVLAGALQAQAPSAATTPTTQQPAPPTTTSAGTPAPAAQPAAPANSAPVATTTADPAVPATQQQPATPAATPSTATPAAPAQTAPTSAPAATAPATPTTPVATPTASNPAPAASPATPAAPAAKPEPAATKPAASTTTTPAAKPAQAAPAAKPAATAPAAKASGDAPKSDKAADDKPKQDGEGGFAFQPGATFGTTTIDGKTWTRLSFTPEISFGKLGVGFNVELFLDENQDLSTRGWDFDTPRNGLESVLRKIDYVRWDHPGATFYARLGTLEGIDMGYGLVASNYGNKDRYPDYKELGTHVQFNDITGLGVDLEAVVNNLQDIQNGGPFTAFRAGLRPFKPMGIPLFQKLAVRAGVAYDWNQYAGLRDQDDDGCPDVVDKAPTSRKTCVTPTDIGDLPDLDTAKSTGYNLHRRDSFDLSRSEDVRDRYSMRKPFGIFWAEATLPVIESKIFGLELHSAFAKPETQDPDAVDAGWGAIPLGAGAHLGPIQLTAEYRAYSQPFQPGHFNALYGSERAKFIRDEVTTKELEIYGKDVAQEGMMHGYFASASWDIFGFLKAQADYSHMFPSKSDEEELRSAGGTVGIGPQVTSILQNKVSLAEVYWQKERIGLDRWTDSKGDVWADAFFGKSIYTVYGYRIGSQVASGLTLIVDRQTTFTRNKEGKLKSSNQMRIETQMKF